MRYILCIATILIILFATFSKNPVFASSDYVLPYPSFMPGSKFYKVSLVIDELKTYWYFGDFSQFIYNLQQADKYLVEAKTLIEYKQYLLAYNALEKSNKFFSQIKPHLLKAKKQKKNITEKKKILNQAIEKHIEILTFIYTVEPRSYIWVPEKGESSTLNFEKLIQESISIRKSSYE